MRPAHLIDLGCEYVLITGTHENTPQVVNTLYGEQRRAAQRQPGNACPAATTARAAPWPRPSPPPSPTAWMIAEAVSDAQEFTWQTLKAGFRPGMGQYIPDRLFWAREATKSRGCRA